MDHQRLLAFLLLVALQLGHAGLEALPHLIPFCSCSRATIRASSYRTLSSTAPGAAPGDRGRGAVSSCSSLVGFPLKGLTQGRIEAGALGCVHLALHEVLENLHHLVTKLHHLRPPLDPCRHRSTQGAALGIEGGTELLNLYGRQLDLCPRLTEPPQAALLEPRKPPALFEALSPTR